MIAHLAIIVQYCILQHDIFRDANIKENKKK